MNYLVIYPGRFHPFHLGHQATYNFLTRKFGTDSVYVVSSRRQDDASPFGFDDKEKMMIRLGVPAGRIVPVKNPYQATEITSALSDEQKANTAIIFAVSEKDAERFDFRPKTDGTASYLQALPDDIKRLRPMTQQGYVTVAPTVNFRVSGQDANSASQIRQLYKDANDNDREQIIADLYGAPDAELRDIFDQRLGADAPQEGIIYGQEQIYTGDNPVTVMRERGEKLRTKITEIRQQLANFRQRQLTENSSSDYIDECRTRKK